MNKREQALAYHQLPKPGKGEPSPKVPVDVAGRQFRLGRDTGAYAPFAGHDLGSQLLDHLRNQRRARR